jgi:glycosyltransferase involved in cell wall biosynthesis
MSARLPRVSVIMPCYNQGQYLNAAVDSVLAQTFQDFEIIVIDDGSTDRTTVQLLQTYEKPKLTVIHTANRGPSAARNTGIQRAIGEYILPLDADDRIDSTFLAKAVSVLDNDPQVGIVYSQAELFGTTVGRFDLPPYSFPEILLGNMIFNTSLYRRNDWETAGGYNENMVWGWEDYDFWLSLLELGRTVVQIPEVLYFHREVPNSRSQQMTQEAWVKSHAQIFRNHPQLYADHIEVLFQEMQALRTDVMQTHARLAGIINTLQQSQFWKVKRAWWQVQRKLGRSVDIGDELLN